MFGAFTKERRSRRRLAQRRC